jgi:hypothetical protein
VGIASTLGLMGVVSLPRAFVVRVSLDDPHPIPWIRMKLSCAMGRALYPHPQWDRLAAAWESFYPIDDLSENKRRLFGVLEATMPNFVALLVNHRPASLRGKSLTEAMEVEERQPAQLRAYYRHWRNDPSPMRAAPPSLVFAVIGQARADRAISPEQESRTLAELLTHWALRSSLDTTALCAAQPALRAHQSGTWLQNRMSA